MSKKLAVAVLTAAFSLSMARAWAAGDQQFAAGAADVQAQSGNGFLLAKLYAQLYGKDGLQPQRDALADQIAADTANQDKLVNDLKAYAAASLANNDWDAWFAYETGLKDQGWTTDPKANPEHNIPEMKQGVSDLKTVGTLANKDIVAKIMAVVDTRSNMTDDLYPFHFVDMSYPDDNHTYSAFYWTIHDNLIWNEPDISKGALKIRAEQLQLSSLDKQIAALQQVIAAASK